MTRFGVWSSIGVTAVVASVLRPTPVVAAPQDTPAPQARRQAVVGHAMQDLRGEITLVLTLEDGSRLEVLFHDGKLLLNGRDVASYRPEGRLDFWWDTLLRRAATVETAEIVRALSALSASEVSEAEVAARDALAKAVAQLAGASTVPVEVADAPPVVVPPRVTVAVPRVPAVEIGEVPGPVIIDGGPSVAAQITMGALNLAAVFVALAFMGLGILFFAPRQLETVADTVWHSFGRSFLAGLFAQPLVLPLFVMLIVGLAVTVVGILVIPFAIAAFAIGLLLAVVGGFVAVARSLGEVYLRRKMARGEAVQTWGAFRYIVYGLAALLALWLPVVLLGWVPIAGTVLAVSAALITWVVATAGFGATIISRAGIRGTFVRRLDLALTDEQYWTDEGIPTPVPRQRVPRSRR